MAEAGEHSNESVGVIGLGRIGGAVTRCIAAAGWQVTGYDVRGEAEAELPELRAFVPTPAAVARSASIVFVAVVDEAQLRDVLGGPDGLLAGAHEELLIVVLSTVSLNAIDDAARLAAAAGVALLDCGVTGGGAASPGQLVALIGGEQALVARVTPLVETFSKLVLHMGPLGAGMQTKLARNVVTYGGWLVADEAARLIDRLGIDRELFVRAVRESAENVGPSWAWLSDRTFGAAATEEELNARRLFTAELMRKDLAAAEQLGALNGLDMPVTRMAKVNAGRVVGLSGGGGSENADEFAIAGATESEQCKAGARTMETVYGFSVDEERYESSLLSRYTLRHLFAEIWARPKLSIRDRRLLTMGAVAAMGRGELWELQLRGALANGEVTVDQVQEMVLHMVHYIGWPRTIAIERAVQKVLAEMESAPGVLDEPAT
jgi:3-hydroxyisobutyrate dehydrogenase-like beta-hydroxyacid dehydrogenase/alkylhydroperoxidase/carboxymuconolactone decarboxylase family protein YurZ